MTQGVISIVLTLILVGTQKYFSRRPNWLLGAMIPILSAAFLIGMFLLKDLPLSPRTVFPCVFLLLLEILIWVDQRFELRRAEMNKMKARDI